MPSLKLWYVISLVLCLLASLAPRAAVAVEAQAIVLDESNPRTETLLNFDWHFRHGEITDDHQPDAKLDDRWEFVQLPHDASICGPFTRENSDGRNGWRPRGCGVYRKMFTLPKEAKGKLVLVEFEGVYRDAHVWVNGEHVAHELNGYLGFEADLTPHVEFGGRNVLIVSYDNRRSGTSRWYTGEGVYRDVWLRIVEPVHVPLHGTCVTTPKVSNKQATVAIETRVTSVGGHRADYHLQTEIIGPDGNIAGSGTANDEVRSDDGLSFHQELRVNRPKLWDLDSPHLYTAVSKVFVGDRWVDVNETRFGIRTIEMTPDRGLLLNGKKIVAKGGNLHHDLGCLGSAALKAGYEKHMDELKAIGCNSVRLAHNPHASVLLDVCDEKGVLVFNEAYDKWNSQFYGGEMAFESQWKRDLERFIRRDRNHPCVYIWSMGNEVMKQQGKHDKRFETPSAAADFGAGLMRRMRDCTHELEPTRPVTAGLFPARERVIKEWEHWDDYETFTRSKPAEMAFEMDVVSWNYTENMFAIDHENYPKWMFIASETGTNLDFGHRRPSWLEIDTSYVIGHYYWSAYDYLGESVWPKKSWGRALIDLSGWVTPIGRYYQSFYSDEPMVHIMVRETDPEINERFEAIENKRWDWYPMVDHWTWPGRETAELTTFTNCEQVELLLNAKSLGVKKLEDGENSRIDWKIPYTPGELTAIARNGDEVVARHTLRTAGEPVAIRLTPHKNAMTVSGLDLVYIDVELVDGNGVILPEKGREIRFEVSGSGVNAGVANGNVISDELWQADTRSTWNGRCRLIVRARRCPGQIVVRASAEDLPVATLVIPVK